VTYSTECVIARTGMAPESLQHWQRGCIYRLWKLCISFFSVSRH